MNIWVKNWFIVHFPIPMHSYNALDPSLVNSNLNSNNRKKRIKSVKWKKRSFCSVFKSWYEKVRAFICTTGDIAPNNRLIRTFTFAVRSQCNCENFKYLILSFQKMCKLKTFWISKKILPNSNMIPKKVTAHSYALLVFYKIKTRGWYKIGMNIFFFN